MSHEFPNVKKKALPLLRPISTIGCVFLKSKLLPLRSKRPSWFDASRPTRVSIGTKINHAEFTGTRCAFQT